MEQELDFIAKGEKVWHELCSDCYTEIVKSIEPLKGNEKESIKIDDQHTYIIGKHGPVIKHTIGDNTNFKSVKKDIDIKKLRNGEYKLEEILETQKFSGKILGQYKDCDLVLKKGKFGLYVAYGENSKSLNGINIEEHDITYEDVIRFIENSNKDSSVIRVLNQQLSLRKGKYGNYVFYKTESMKKPQFLKLKGFNKNPETCSKDEFINWIKTTYKLK
jgi:DNA topoisomerase-1